MRKWSGVDENINYKIALYNILRREKFRPLLLEQDLSEVCFSKEPMFSAFFKESGTKSCNGVCIRA